MRTDHAPGGATGELGIGIKCDDESDLRQDGEIADFDGKAVVLATKQLIEIHELAALPLPAHPNTLARVIQTVAMEQQE